MMAGTGGAVAPGSGGGGVVGATGGASTGSGGSSATGGSATGGAASGGTSSGGGTSLPPLTGDCAGKPAFDDWSSTTGMQGDQVVHACTSNNVQCTAAGKDVLWLWECLESHVANCGQEPGTTGSWGAVKDCTDMGAGGAGP